jgi:group I intron endonuclease
MYGEANFIFQIIEIVDDKGKVVEREQWYLDHMQRDRCYNIGDVVTNPMQGRTHSTVSKDKISQKNKGQVRSAETIQRMREAKAGIPISEATRIAVAKKNLGRPLSAEHKHKLSLSQMGVPKTHILRGSENGFSKLTESQVIEIKKMLNLGVSVTEIAKMFSMSVPTISAIKVGRNWAHVKADA